MQREWLRRIPGWVWEQRRRPRPRKDEAEGDDAGEEAPAPAAAEDAAPPEASDEVDDTSADGAPPADGDDAADGEPQGASDADGTAQPPPDELPLDVPEDVEQQRREAEQKRRRTARNLGLAPQAFGLEGHYLRNLATRFARMISKVAEDSADLPSEGDEEWDLDALLRRRFSGRLISQCRMTREKRKVAIVLDTSPSCEHQARLFGSIARIAEELGDCELYDAPNFAITARKLHDDWEPLPQPEREWQFQGRAVLAFGDFDGIDRICNASAVRGNRVFWFCCEERPQVLEAGRETFVKRYKGKYFPATDLPQLMHALRRVR